MSKNHNLIFGYRGSAADKWMGSSGPQGSAEKFQLDQAEMDDRHHLTFDTYEVGKIDWTITYRKLCFISRALFSMDEFKEFMFSRTQPYQQMIDYIASLKKQYGLKIAVVSNEGRALTEYRIANFGLKKFVDFFIVSCFVHFRKPDLDIYRVALDIAQVAPEEVAYIEDRPMFVEVAKSLGINSITRHTTYESTKAILDQMSLT